MKKLLFVLLMVSVLVGATIPTVAASGTPVGSCANGFQLHEVMEHNGEHHGEHHHVGNDHDQNGDGFLCVKHVGANGSIHVHTDNNLPLP